MPFLFECPQCGQRRVIAEAAVGRRVRCPACEALVEITLPQEPSASEGDTSTSESADALPLLTGYSISAPSGHSDWNIETPGTKAMPGVPVLAMADDEDEDEGIRIRSSPEESEMDMTPMVDVTFQLLIFFMVTASFTIQRSLEVPAPKETVAASVRSLQEYEEDPDYVTVRVDQYGTFFVTAAEWEEEMECPSEQELLVKLREARRGSGGEAAKIMMVVAHGEAEHARVITAIDAGLTAGIEQVQLVSVEDDDNS